MGGAAGIAVVLGMIRAKFAAVLIGTAGLGLIANFTAIQGLIGTLAGLGLHSSAVREIAVAVGRGDEQAVGRAVLVLRRLCWLTGLFGMVVMILFAPLLSQMTFGHRDYTLDIAALGVIILFGNLAGSYLALIQGMRRIGDIARANIYGNVVGTVLAIGFYVTLGLRGIIPALITVSAIQLSFYFYFARQVAVPPVSLPWWKTLSEASGMIRLGVVFMWNGLMGAAVAYLIVSLITQREGIHAVGLYSAAFALSGMSINFMLGAMGTDYYPRLTGEAHDKHAMVRTVNVQTEIGMLLALPGLLATISLAPWILQIFYSGEFLGAVGMLHWFVLGCLGRVISFPLAYVMLALGKGRWFLLTETSFNLIHIALVIIGLRLYGIEGVAIAFAVMNMGYIFAVYLVSRRLIGFRWSAGCKKLGILLLPVFVVIFIASRMLPLWPATLLGLSLTFVASILCLRGLVARVGFEHRIVRAISRLPGSKLLLFSL